jgi:RNA-binding motif X-linked protein 2
MGRMLRVDHVRYKRRDEEGDVDNVAVIMGQGAEGTRRDDDIDNERRERKQLGRRHSDVSNVSDAENQPRPLLKEEKELAELMRNHDDEDPMKEYLIQEKKEEIALALEKLKSSKKSSRRGDDPERSHRHRHRHHHRRRHSDDRSRSRERSRREKDTSPSHDKPPRERSSSRQRTPYRDRPRSPDRSYRDRSRTKSRSPGRKQDRRRRDYDR